MKYIIYNVTGALIKTPCEVERVSARDYEDAFIKSKEKLCKGIKQQLGLVDGTKILFTTPKQDISVGYGDGIRYTTCCLEDANGFVFDTYEYAIAPV